MSDICRQYALKVLFSITNKASPSQIILYYVILQFTLLNFRTRLVRSIAAILKESCKKVFQEFILQKLRDISDYFTQIMSKRTTRSSKRAAEEKSSSKSKPTKKIRLHEYTPQIPLRTPESKSNFTLSCD